MPQVALPNHYFRKTAKREYSNWRVALVREFFQNSIDAGASNFEISLSDSTVSEHQMLVVKDNGCGMSLDTCINKLLTMGESGKPENAIGGFGIAKGLLFFAWDMWQINSRNYRIIGEGCHYNIEQIENSDDYVNGVNAVICLNKDEDFNIDYIKNYLSLCETHANIYINEERFDQKKYKGRKLKSINWGTLYKAKTIHGIAVRSAYMLVRVNGVSMFSQYISENLDCQLTFELTGNTREILTSNRNGFTEPYSSEFQAIVQDIATNVKSATDEKDEITLQKISGSGLERIEEPREIVPTFNFDINQLQMSARSKEEIPVVPSNPITIQEPEAPSEKADYPDVLMKMVGKKVSTKFHPRFWPYKVKTIMKLWTMVLRQIMIDNKIFCNFGIGLTFDPDNEAEFIHYDGAPFFLLNIETWNGTKKSKKGKTLLPKINGKHGWRLIQELKQRAAHEIGHHVTGKDHNERFITRVHALEANTWANEDKYKSLLKSVTRRNQKKVVDSIRD